MDLYGSIATKEAKGSPLLLEFGKSRIKTSRLGRNNTQDIDVVMS
jgi:hypothetical protein